MHYVCVDRLSNRRDVLAPGDVSTIGEDTALPLVLTSSSSNQLLTAPRSIFQTFPFEGSVSTISLKDHQHHASDAERTSAYIDRPKPESS